MRPNEEMTLDGNAAAGELAQIFSAEMTRAESTCAGCGVTRALGSARLFVGAGYVLRCTDCGAVLLRLVRAPERCFIELTGIRLRFEGGAVVDASARTNEPFLLETLDSDEGARRLGELGIGCNPGITRYMKNTLFDEKIDGTVHLALGNGLPDLGGRNVSAIHWDIVKDLRSGGRIELDGVVVQRDGAWTT